MSSPAFFAVYFGAKICADMMLYEAEIVVDILLSDMPTRCHIIFDPTYRYIRSTRIDRKSLFYI